MAAAVISEIEASFFNADYVFLQRCFDAEMEKSSKLQQDWVEIGKLIHSRPQPFPIGSRSIADFVHLEKERLKSALALSKTIHSKLHTFRADYAEFLDNAQVETLDRFVELAASGIKSSEAFYYLHKSDCATESLEKLKFLKIAIDLYGESLPVAFSRQVDAVNLGRMSGDEYAASQNALKVFLVHSSNYADEVVLSERGFGHLTEMHVLRKNIKDVVMSLMWQISRISEGKEPLGYVLVEIEGKLLALEKQSAETKTIQRIHDAEEQSNWITYIDRDKKIDANDLKNRLKAGGYVE